MGNESLIVLDTHVLIWWITGTAKLSTKARKSLAGASSTTPAVASTISVLEIVTAVRRGRLQFSVPIAQWLSDIRTLPELCFEPVSLQVAQLAGSLGDQMHGDPADRLIAATALILGGTLITADEKLLTNRQLKTLW
jgi:PIN domain nuclease of toxin-antitoxin system